MSTKYIWTKEESLFKNKILPNNFRLLIIGSSGCGKNVLLMNMLLTEGFLDYDNLIFYSTTINQFALQVFYYGMENGLTKEEITLIFENQKLADHCKTALEVIEFFIEKKLVQQKNKTINVTLSNKPSEIIPCEKLRRDKKNLIIFDDVVNEKNQEIQKNYFTRGRHSNCNVIYISQTYFNLDKNSIRNNSNCYIFFKLNKTDRDNVYYDLFSNIFENKMEYDYQTKLHWKTKYNYYYLDREKEDIIDDLFQ